ncbi:MAG: PQQ-binding-like beta-propeller repeat protein [Gemmatimonadota bacterium]|nr:PQQ-binding-like beta-propeller repeat protein [Gemmatimonadota bacterium]
MWEYLESPARSPSADEQLAPDPEVVWRADVGRGTVGEPAMGERVTVVTSADRFVYAIDTRTGGLFWRHHSDASFGVGPVIGEEAVFAATEGVDGKVEALALRDGKRIWQIAVGDVGAPLVLRDSILYVATQDGAALAVTTRGKVLWHRRVGSTRSGPLVTRTLVAIATLGDSLIVLERSSGLRQSHSALPVTTAAPLALANDSTAVLASPSGALLGLALPSGLVRWRIDTSEPIPGVPVIARDTLFALGGSCTLWIVPLARPTAVDSTAIPGCGTSAGPAVLRDGVLVATVRGEITFFDRTTRKRLWTRALGSELRHPPVVHNRQIVAAPIIGRLVSFR